MDVGLLTVGDALLAGETTNAAWLAGADRTAGRFYTAPRNVSF